MERWTRDDGRYLFTERETDLFGLVVVVYYGGRFAHRMRSIPVTKIEEADRVIERIGKRRAAHGYRREGL